MMKPIALSPLLALVVGCSVAQASDLPACNCEAIGRLNEDGSVTLPVTTSTQAESTWQAVLEKKAGQATVKLRNERSGDIQRFKVKLDNDYRVELEPFDLPRPSRIAERAPGIALRLWDGGTAGVRAYLIAFDPATSKFGWIKDGRGKKLLIFNPSTSWHEDFLVGSTSGSGYHDVLCFRPSAIAGRMQLLRSAYWTYPDVWKITGYGRGRVKHTRLSDSNRTTSGTCEWALEQLAKSG